CFCSSAACISVAWNAASPTLFKASAMKGLLFTYLLTYGGALAALFNPFHGLLVYVCFAIVRPDKMWFWSVPEGNYSRIVGIALLLGWLAHGCGCWHFG